MFKLLALARQSVFVLLWTLSLAFAAALATTAQAQQSSPQSSNQPAPRRALPKPVNGARGFEQTTGASSRLIQQGAVRGGPGDPLKPLAPIEGLAYNARPFFRWQPAFGEKSYHFELRDGNVRANPAAAAPVIYETDVATAQLSYPESAPPLAPGKLYSWRVSVKGAGGERRYAKKPPATFFILSGEDAAQVKQALEKERLVTPTTARDRLRQARIFEEYGVWYDALRIASEVKAEDPSNKEAVEYLDSLIKRLDLAES